MVAETVALEWDEKYSVGVTVLDHQHQQMFRMINDLVNIIQGVPEKERIGRLLDAIIEYKRVHFATEEGYFKEFNFEGAAEHIAEHQKFNETLMKMKKQYADDTIGLAFALVDFLEDWLVQHLLHTDQKYKECFRAHGLT